jgi:hypothetical protein
VIEYQEYSMEQFKIAFCVFLAKKLKIIDRYDI